jgi:hypothetical protein
MRSRIVLPLALLAATAAFGYAVSVQGRGNGSNQSEALQNALKDAKYNAKYECHPPSHPESIIVTNSSCTYNQYGGNFMCEVEISAECSNN